MIHVCSLARLHRTVEDIGARHVVSLLGDEARLERPAAIAPENHLWLRLHDISSPLDGYMMPERSTHCGSCSILCASGTAALRWWCIASPASAARPQALSPASARFSPHRDEDNIAQALRRASPTATPNIRIVSLADRLLGRDGRMVAAIEIHRPRHGGRGSRTVSA